MVTSQPNLGLEQFAGGNTSAETDDDLKAVIYARTSSASQRFGYSIEEQVRQCWERCQMMGWTVSHVFRDEAVSGKDTDRPMFQRLIEQVESETINVVVFWKLDRFSRSLIHAVQLERDFREHGVALHSITEQIDTTTPTGRFNFRNISSASEFERELIKQRSRMGMKALAMKHKWPNSKPPFGYVKSKDERLEVHPKEAANVRKIFRRYIEAKSMAEVANQLNDLEISTKNSTDWTPQIVGNLLRNGIYIGRYSVSGVNEYVAEYQILSENLFEEATAVRTRYQKPGDNTREKMDKSIKKARASRITNQYRNYLGLRSD